MPLPDFTLYSARELLAANVSILNELITRGIIRTRNAPQGDLAEFLAVAVYSGIIEPNSAKSYDLIAGDGRRIQVKSRALAPGKHAGAFSYFRSFDFEVALFVVFDAQTYDVRWARELSAVETQSIATWSQHAKAWICQAPAVARMGNDVTEQVRYAYLALDAPSAIGLK